MAKLNSLKIQKVSKPGLYGDGNGLYLQVSATGSKSWLFRYMINKRARAMGLGPINLVSLAEARIKLVEYRKQLLDGIDPLEAKDTKKKESLVAKAKEISFEKCADAYIEAHKTSWKNAKHTDQWKNTLTTYAHPIIGSLSVQDIDTALVMKVLEPVWYVKSETASRLRNRIELILSWATVRGYRKGDNPAKWIGHLDQLLPKRSSVQPRKHFTALPVNEIGGFMEKLRSMDCIAALALEFLILTATRTNEVLDATWEEINWEEQLWIIPATRMKAKREHRVPLTKRMLEILHLARVHDEDQYLFPGRKRGKPLSNNAFLSLLKKRMNISATVHGFRSCFRDWASERTSHSREAVELSLAHTVKDSTERAYFRSDLLLKRKALMIDWEAFCSCPSVFEGKVLTMERAIQNKV